MSTEQTTSDMEALRRELRRLTQGPYAAHYKFSYAVRNLAKEVIPALPSTCNFQALIDDTGAMRAVSGCDNQPPPVQYADDVLPPAIPLTRQTVDYDQQRLAYGVVVDLLTARRNHFQQP